MTSFSFIKRGEIHTVLNFVNDVFLYFLKERQFVFIDDLHLNVGILFIGIFLLRKVLEIRMNLELNQE
jgi:hypothetical protein